MIRKTVTAQILRQGVGARQCSATAAVVQFDDPEFSQGPGRYSGGLRANRIDYFKLKTAGDARSALIVGVFVFEDQLQLVLWAKLERKPQAACIDPNCQVRRASKGRQIAAQIATPQIPVRL